MKRPCTRRSALHLGAVGLAALAGCTTENPGGTTPERSSTGTEARSTTSSTTETTATASEANEGESGVTVQWTASIGGRIPIPAVDEDTVYVTSSKGGLSAFDRTGGNRRWRVSTGGASYLGPRVADETVYCPAGNDLLARATSDGGHRWTHEWEGWLSSMPTIDGDTVFVGNTDPELSHDPSSYPEDLFALAIDDGSVRWKRSLGDHDELGGDPLVAGGRLYAQVESSDVYALDPTDGTTIWHTPTPAGRGGAYEGPVMAGETLVAISGGSLVGIDPSSGDVRWTFGGVKTAPVTDGEAVYAGDFTPEGTQSTVYSVDPRDGSELWSRPIPGRLKTWSALSAAPGTLYVSATEAAGDRGSRDDLTTLYAIDAAGTEQWRFKRTCDGFSRVVVADGIAYVAGRYGDGTLYALAPR